MATIEVNIREDSLFLEELGKQKLQEIVQQYVDFKQFEMAAQQVNKAMDKATEENGINWNEEFENIRQEAWEEYKAKRGL